MIAFDIGSQKKLHRIAIVPSGGDAAVSSSVTNDDRSIAVANYNSQSIDIFELNANGTFTDQPAQTYKLSITKPGPDLARQDKPYPHQCLWDPSSSFLLVPDLGADLIRVYGRDSSTLKTTQLSPVKLKAGSGPRHVVFPHGKDQPDRVYSIQELNNTVNVYDITYDEGNTPTLTLSQTLSTLDASSNLTVTTPEAPGQNAAEIAISPDNRFLYASNRGNSKTEDDSIAIYSVAPDTGRLTYLQLQSSYGRSPRQFEISADGRWVAIANQQSGEVVVVGRDVKTGLMGEPAARLAVPQVAIATWA